MNTNKKILSFFRPIPINFFTIILFLLTFEGIIFFPGFAEETPLKTFLLADERPSVPDTGQPEDQIANGGTTRAKAPPNGTPDGESRPGTTRDLEACPKTNNPPLTAIFANRGNDFTVSEYPTFWFYIPYAAEDIQSIKFILTHPDRKKTIYRTAVQLTQQPGIIKITIPSIPEYALEVDQDYHWYFNLRCQPDSTSQPLVVHGWIRRVSSNIQLASLTPVNLNQYLDDRYKNIWYDAITELAKNRLANPNNSELSDAWGKLLEELGFKDISSKPFVQSELLPPEI